jgi:hypothetical protein
VPCTQKLYATFSPTIFTAKLLRKRKKAHIVPRKKAIYNNLLPKRYQKAEPKYKFSPQRALFLPELIYVAFVWRSNIAKKTQR